MNLFCIDSSCIFYDTSSCIVFRCYNHYFWAMLIAGDIVNEKLFALSNGKYSIAPISTNQNRSNKDILSGVLHVIMLGTTLLRFQR